MDLDAWLNVLTVIGMTVGLYVYLVHILIPCVLTVRHSIMRDRWFGWFHALGTVLPLHLYLTSVGSLYRLTRHRIEVELLRPRPELEFRPTDDVAARREKIREHRALVREWKGELKKSLRRVIESDQGDSVPNITVETCFELSEAQGSIERYFAAVNRSPRRAGESTHSFLSSVTIERGFVAPLHLLTGLLSQMAENWPRVLAGYDPLVGSNEPMDRLRAFLFNCWLLWGPSIPICTCARWNGVHVVMQYGFGDENNSLPLLVDRAGDVSTLLNESTRGELAHPMRLKCRLEWGPPLNPGDVAALPPAQRSIRDPDTGGLLLHGLELGELRPELRPDLPLYYSAYLWVMFVVRDDEAIDEPWRMLLPFFEHANVADADAMLTLKRQLARKAMSGIAQLVKAGPRSSVRHFEYACAIDDPGGCGKKLRCESALPTLRTLMSEMLATNEFAALRMSGWVRLDGPFDARFGACHLPDLVAKYYDAIDERAEAGGGR